MPAAGLRRWVAPVPGNPLPHGLLSGCVDVVDVTDVHEMLGTEWRPLSCAEAHPAAEWCPDDGEPPGVPVEKEFTRPGICNADPVTLYAGAECSAPGWTYQDAVRHARETLRMGEQRALEEHYMREVLCEIADDLTPAAGAVSIAQAVSILENALGTSYGGTGLIHAPAGAAALLSRYNLAFPDGNCLRTLLGNGLVLGAGYAVNVGPPGCTPADPGEAWLYGTSPVRVRRETPNTVPDTDRASVDTRVNDRRVLVERTFVVETACCDAVAVRTTLC